MSNDTYAPLAPFVKRVFDRRAINMYKDACKKVHIIDMGWLTWCDFVNRDGVSDFRLYNQYF